MVDMRETIMADEARVKEITNTLLHAFNAYLEEHHKTAFPDALMGVNNFFAAVLDHQAIQMRLSPQQREAYYQAVMGTLHAMLQANLEHEQLVAVTKPAPKGVKKKKLGGN